MHVTASADLVWDDLVAQTCVIGWAGLECLSGIPSWVGAVPVQKVGAYAQEVGDTADSRHPEIARGLSAVRDAVLAVRRRESMVYDVANPNHRSAGSFFTNPIVPTPWRQPCVQPLATRRGCPTYPTLRAGMKKLSAAWLIERAGFSPGTVFHDGSVGLSSRHCLACINLGHATAEDTLEFPQHIQARDPRSRANFIRCFVTGICTKAQLGEAGVD